jgi:hypothetical protein
MYIIKIQSIMFKKKNIRQKKQIFLPLQATFFEVFTSIAEKLSVF